MANPGYNFPPLSENQAKKLRALKLKKNRDRDKAFLAEGLRLCEEAISANADIVLIVVTVDALQQPRRLSILKEALSRKIPVFLATPRLFNSMSDEKSPQGILCVVAQKVSQTANVNGNLILACDNLQDPGNLGTILRSAEWFGVQDILLGAGCVDLYNPKVVRASMGAIFRLSVHQNIDLVAALGDLKTNSYNIIGTLLESATQLADMQPTGKDVLLIGNEANGLSDELRPLIDVPVCIPGRGKGESLNAAIAASIFLYHFSH